MKVKEITENIAILQQYLSLYHHNYGPCVYPYVFKVTMVMNLALKSFASEYENGIIQWHANLFPGEEI